MRARRREQPRRRTSLPGATAPPARRSPPCRCHGAARAPRRSLPLARAFAAPRLPRSYWWEGGAGRGLSVRSRRRVPPPARPVPAGTTRPGLTAAAPLSPWGRSQPLRRNHGPAPPPQAPAAASSLSGCPVTAASGRSERHPAAWGGVGAALGGWGRGLGRGPGPAGLAPRRRVRPRLGGMGFLVRKTQESGLRFARARGGDPVCSMRWEPRRENLRLKVNQTLERSNYTNCGLPIPVKPGVSLRGRRFLCGLGE